MKNLTPYLEKLEMILSNHQHPETDLFQLYNSLGKEQQLSLVASMIGKLIEQNKRLKTIQDTNKQFKKRS